LGNSLLYNQRILRVDEHPRQRDPPAPVG
jgi:hypothetical protein